MTAILEDVKPPVEDIALPEVLGVELSESEAKNLLCDLRAENWDFRNHKAKCHASTARFRRLVLKLYEGKGYRHAINERTGEPFRNIEEVFFCVFNIKRVQMYEMIHAAETERQLYGKTAIIRTKRDGEDIVCTSYTYSERDSTATNHVLETLRLKLKGKDAQTWAHVYFHACHFAHDTQRGYSGKSHPTGMDIRWAAAELGHIAEAEGKRKKSSIEKRTSPLSPSENPAMPTLEQHIRTFDAAGLQRLKALIAAEEQARESALSTPPPAPRKTKQVTVQEDTPLPVGARVQLGAYRCLIKRTDAALDEVSYCIEGEASGQVYTVPRHTLHGHPATLPA